MVTLYPCAGCRQSLPAPHDVISEHNDATGAKCPGSGSGLGDEIVARPGGDVWPNRLVVCECCGKIHDPPKGDWFYCLNCMTLNKKAQ